MAEDSHRLWELHFVCVHGLYLPPRVTQALLSVVFCAFGLLSTIYIKEEESWMLGSRKMIIIKHPFFLLAVVVAFAVLATGDVELELFDKIRVDITNQLGSGKGLTIHCRSKDDDIGERFIANGADYAWDFRVNAWGSTLFYCALKWDGMSRFHFDSYSTRRDFIRCKSSCSWLAAKEGVYGRNEQTGFWEFMYFWP